MNSHQSAPGWRHSRFQVCETALHEISLQLLTLLGDLGLPGQGQYYFFSITTRHMIENLPEPFLTGVKTSSLWRKEGERGGLAITNGLSMYLPETPNEDVLLVLRLGYHKGFYISDLFGLGEQAPPVSGEAGAKEARD
jgi:hypothetical protein